MGHGKPPPRRCGKGYRTGRYSKPIVAPRARGKKLRRGGGDLNGFLISSCIWGRRGFEPMRSRGVKRAGRWHARSRPRGSGCRRHTRIRSLAPSGLLISAAFSSVLLFRAHDAATEHLVSLGKKPVSLFGCSAPMLDERSISSGERRDCKMTPNYFFKRSLWLKSEKLVLRYSDQFLYLHI